MKNTKKATKKKKDTLIDFIFTILMLVAFWTGWVRIESAIMFLALCVLLCFERDGIKVKIRK